MRSAIELRAACIERAALHKQVERLSTVNDALRHKTLTSDAISERRQRLTELLSLSSSAVDGVDVSSPVRAKMVRDVMCAAFRARSRAR